MDWIPGLSQVKALAQVLTGDIEGAKRTTDNFLKECPGVSQVTSVVQLATGDVEGAKDTQKRCLSRVNNVTNGIPVVGHAKGLVQHAYGDHEGGNRALNAATRSTVVVASGAAAAVATGGIGAIPIGIAAGMSYDIGASVVTGTEQGSIEAIKNVVENLSAGTIIDAVAIPVADGFAAYAGGQMATKMELSNIKSLEAARLEKINAANESKGEKLSSHLELVVGTYVVAASVPRSVIEPEDAIYHDSYVETMIITDNDRQQAQQNMRDSDQQTPERSLFYAFPGTKLITPQELSDIIGSSSGDPNRNPDRKPFKNTPECLRDLFRQTWLLLILPNEFMFTLAAQLNNGAHGYFHSFVRHINEWAQVLPSDVSQVLPHLSPILNEIRSVADANYKTKGPLKRLLKAIWQLSNEKTIELQRALSDMQLSMHSFIERNITFENYQGRSRNTNGGDRLFFKVETESGTKAMVLCLSNERVYPVAGDSRPGRPVRMLITVYFESWDKFKRHGLLETKKEMQRRPKK